MTKYRKKPIVVEAEQFEPTRKPWPEGVEQWEAVRTDEVGAIQETVYHWRVTTLEGDMAVRPGDWIITGVEGERYPCKPDIFEATYEETPDA